MSDSLRHELERMLGPDGLPPRGIAGYVSDATEGRGFRAEPDAVALPGSAEEVAMLVEWCYEHGHPVVPRGGGSGFSGGGVPFDGGLVISLERMRRVLQFDPQLWRIRVEAGLVTSEVHRLARENGLYFPPDPGAAEQSHIGGNIATNAGGPHAFKYGVTGAWVTGVEAVLPPGRIVRSGGPVRKDVSGYDLKSLLIGSEGTLGIVTSAWLRLIPAPEVRRPVAAFYEGSAQGCAAILRVLEAGLQPATLEYLDAATFRAARTGFPVEPPESHEFLVIAEADGSETGAEELRDDLVEVLGEGAAMIHSPVGPKEIGDLWRWRDGVSIAVTTLRGGKVSEDIVVPIERLEEAIVGTDEIGLRHELPTCSWGHAGDGNLHSTFMVSREDAEGLERAERAAAELFQLALDLGGTVSGEHGIGIAKSVGLGAQFSEDEVRVHEEIKACFDPLGLMNPGKKVPAK